MILSFTSVSSDRSWARYVPRYLNLFINFTNLFSEIMNLPEISSSSVSSIGLECAGKYMASVLDFKFGMLVQPRWTSSPNCAKVSFTKVVPVMRSDLERNINAESTA